MEQGVTAVIITMMIVFVFLPALFLGMLNSNRQKINEAMYLSTRCLENCVLDTEYSMEDLAQGYGYSEDPIMRVKIDEAKLFTEFDDLLFKNINNAKEYVKVRSNILCEMLIYPDRYVVWTKAYPDYIKGESKDVMVGGKKKYSYNYDSEYEKYLEGKHDTYVTAPKYFTYKEVNLRAEDKNVKVKGTAPATDGYYYINTVNNKVRKFGSLELWRNIKTEIEDLSSTHHYDMLGETTSLCSAGACQRCQAGLGNSVPLTAYDKNQVIIDTLNKEISYYTNGVKMNFINPASTRQQNLEATKKEFNFFEGITFLVVYKDESFLALASDVFKFNQYTVVGYTLEN